MDVKESETTTTDEIRESLSSRASGFSEANTIEPATTASSYGTTRTGETTDIITEFDDSSTHLYSGSDHDFKTKLWKYYKKAINNLDEDRVRENLQQNIIGISPHELFNLLNQETSQHYSKLSDVNYLLIIDTRSAGEYNAGHIVTATHIAFKNGLFQPIFGWELECKQNLVVYDAFGHVADITTTSYQCAKMLLQSGSRYPIKILNGGYAGFCRLYPDYWTIQILYTPEEKDNLPTYPNEIIQNLYIGRIHHAQASFVHRELKIKAHINCEMKPTQAYFPDNYPFKFHVPVNDYEGKDIKKYFVPAADFIESNLLYTQPVLIYSTSGNSAAAAIAMSYLISKRGYTLQKSYALVKKCRTSVTPALEYMAQLAELEQQCFPDKRNMTDIEWLINSVK